jgi:hypothetical protein
VKQFVLNSSVQGNAEIQKDEQAQTQCLSSAEKLQTQVISAQQIDTSMAEIRER